MVYEETRFILRDFLTRAVRDAIVYSGKSHLPPHPASSSRADPRWNGSTLQPQDRAYDRRDLRAQAAGPYAVLLLNRKRHHVAAQLPATSTAQQPRPELHHAIPLLSA